MNDCSNAEIRDQLPELVHDRLDAARRAEIAAHLSGCAECRAEMELLGAARAMFDAQTPRVDVTYIVNALPLARPRVAPVEHRRPKWTDWRIAAAVTLIVAGGSSLAVLRNGGRYAAPADATIQAAVPVAPVNSDSSSSITRTQPAPGSQTTPGRAAVLASSGDQSSGLGATRLGDLTEQQLKTLLDEIDQLQPTPITDPEPVSIRVRENSSGAPEGA